MKGLISFLAVLLFLVVISCTKTKNATGSYRCACGWQIPHSGDTTIIYYLTGTLVQVDSECSYKKEQYINQHGTTADCQLMY